MGMDLKPVRPTKAAPRDENGEPVWGYYNWTGWTILGNQLIEWGHSDLVNYMSGWNDGEVIPSKICKQIGKAIKEHLDEEEDDDWREFQRTKVTLWETCGGYKQF